MLRRNLQGLSDVKEDVAEEVEVRGSEADQQRQPDPTRRRDAEEAPPCYKSESKVYTRYLKAPVRYSSSDWLEAIRTWPESRIMRQVLNPVLVMTAWAFLVCSLHCYFGLGWLSIPTLDAHLFLVSGLSLLLVFRTNSAYQRFQEGRAIWNDILDLCRDIAFSVSLFREEAGPAKILEIKKAVQAFPWVMQEHVRAQASTGMRQRLHNLLEDLDEVAPSGRLSIRMETPGLTRNRPLNLIHRLLMVIKSIKHPERFTNRERVWLLGMVTKLSHTVGRCERLVQTPVPRAYARHTSRFLSLWTLTLPFAVVVKLRWLTAPVVFLIAWALFSILEIGHTIEDPFRNTIELSPICEAIELDARRVLATPQRA